MFLFNSSRSNLICGSFFPNNSFAVQVPPPVNTRDKMGSFRAARKLNCYICLLAQDQRGNLIHSQIENKREKCYL